ncbi:MAG TPA: hypothetical protein VGG30_04870 [Pirellulales bacterium]
MLGRAIDFLNQVTSGAIPLEAAADAAQSQMPELAPLWDYLRWLLPQSRDQALGYLSLLVLTIYTTFTGMQTLRDPAPINVVLPRELYKAIRECHPDAHGNTHTSPTQGKKPSKAPRGKRKK